MNGIRNAYFQALDALCILVALYVSGEIMLPAEYNVLVDYTGASTFTTFFFLLFFYVLDCYNVGHEDVRDSIARVSVASVLGIIFTGFTFYSFEHWRFERTTFVVLLLLVVGMTLLWRMVYHRFGQPSVWLYIALLVFTLIYVLCCHIRLTRSNITSL